MRKNKPERLHNQLLFSLQKYLSLMVINMRAGGLVVKMEEFCFEYLSN